MQRHDQARPDADVSAFTYRVTFRNGQHQEYPPEQILHARGPARDGIKGDSIVMDVREAIGLEIAAETFGASYFGNGAMPGLSSSTRPAPRLQDRRGGEEVHRRHPSGVRQAGRFKSHDRAQGYRAWRAASRSITTRPSSSLRGSISGRSSPVPSVCRRIWLAICRRVPSTT